MSTSIKAPIAHGTTGVVKTGRDGVVIAGASTTGVLMAKYVVALGNFYLPSEAWVLWEPVMNIIFNTFGAVTVFWLVRFFSRAAAAVEAAIEEELR